MFAATVDLFHFDSVMMSNANCAQIWGSYITDDMQCVVDTVPEKLQSACSVSDVSFAFTLCRQQYSSSTVAYSIVTLSLPCM